MHLYLKALPVQSARTVNLLNLRFLSIFAGILVSLLLAGCGNNNADSQPTKPRLQLIATTGQINSALQRITAGVDGIDIKLFCGPGVDPHSFSASTNDVQAMQDADAIFYNGFHLEAKIDKYLKEKFKAKAWSMGDAFPKQMRMEWEEDGQVDSAAPTDPHIWNHLPGWGVAVEALVEKICELDSEHADKYRSNGKAYAKKIAETHQWAKTELAKIPTDRRVLVSAHDAFNYFAREYGLDPVAVLGIGNDPEADIKTMREVSEVIVARKVPVIFMESITNPKVTQALKEACTAKGWKVEIATETLYSDDLGEKPPQDTFLGVFRSNVELIVRSLGESPSDG